MLELAVFKMDALIYLLILEELLFLQKELQDHLLMFSPRNYDFKKLSFFAFYFLQPIKRALL